MQPKIPHDLMAELQFAGLKASCYQPTFLFKKNGRKLPNVAEPSDPWQCFLRRTSAYGVVSVGVGATLREAIQAALDAMPKTGVLPALAKLGVAVDELTGAIHARQD